MDNVAHSSIVPLLGHGDVVSMKARGRARGVTSTFEGPARVITERAPRGRAAPAVMFLAPMSPAAATVAPSCTVVFTTAPTPVGKGGTRTSTELRGLLEPPGVTAMREWLGNPTASCKLRFVLSDEVLNTAALGERVMAAALRRRPRQSSPPPERGPLFLTWAGKGFVIGGSLIGACSLPEKQKELLEHLCTLLART